VRYPRGNGPGALIEEAMTAMEIGRAVMVREGQGAAILSFGTTLAAALEAAEKVNATVVDMRWVKPMDEDTVRAMADAHELIVTIEENALAGGAGSAVNTFLANEGHSVAIANLGIPDRFMEHGSQGSQQSDAGLDAASVEAVIRERLGETLGDAEELVAAPSKVIA